MWKGGKGIYTTGGTKEDKLPEFSLRRNQLK